MPTFSANLSMLFTELPFLDRFAAAGEAGFSAVEFLFPYSFDPHELAVCAKRASVDIVLHNLPAGNWEAGERGIACDPARMWEFRDGVIVGAEYARLLDCPRLNCLAGIPPAALEQARARHTLIDNLAFAARHLEGKNLELLVEPINTRDTPGFYISRTEQALELIDEVGANNLKLQYDIYHAQVMAEDPVQTFEAFLPRIGHIQVADNPGRNEPGTGEIKFDSIFRRLDELGYRGWVGCEYRPLRSTSDGLTWLKAYENQPSFTGE